VTIKRDTAPPDVEGNADRLPGPDGWYTDPFLVLWSGQDSASGIDVAGTSSVCNTTRYNGPDTSGGVVTGTCADKAGNVGKGTFSFKYDNTGPRVVAVPSRPADHNGWYNHPFSLTWSTTDSEPGVSCTSGKSYDGPDTASGVVTGSCTDEHGNTTAVDFPFKYDATAPVASIAADRAPDHDGWYNHLFTATTSATDGTGSGIASCTPANQYGDDEPDTAAGQLTGTCTDVAGNTSGPATLTFKYDDTAPSATLSLDTTNLHNSWYTGPVQGTTTGSDNLSPVSCTAPQTYSGPDGDNLGMEGSCTDAAGNQSLPDKKIFNYDATKPVINLTCPTPLVLGSTASAAWLAADTGSGLANAVSGTMTLATTTVGTKTATVSAGAATDNAGNTSDATSCSYTVSYRWDGFSQPINDTAHTSLYESKFKLGSTVPVKFTLKNAAGTSQQSSTIPQFQVSANRGACDTLTTAETIPDTGASSSTAFTWTNGDYQYNFSTKGKTAGEYRIWATGIDDGINQYVDLCLTK